MDEQAEGDQLQQPVDGVAQYETARFLCRRFGLEGEVGGQEKIAYQTYYIAKGQGYAGACQAKQYQIDTILYGSGYDAHDYEAKRLFIIHNS